MKSTCGPVRNAVRGRRCQLRVKGADLKNRVRKFFCSYRCSLPYDFCATRECMIRSEQGVGRVCKNRCTAALQCTHDPDDLGCIRSAAGHTLARCAVSLVHTYRMNMGTSTASACADAAAPVALSFGHDRCRPRQNRPDDPRRRLPVSSSSLPVARPHNVRDVQVGRIERSIVPERRRRGRRLDVRGADLAVRTV